MVGEQRTSLSASQKEGGEEEEREFALSERQVVNAIWGVSQTPPAYPFQFVVRGCQALTDVRNISTTTSNMYGELRGAPGKPSPSRFLTHHEFPFYAFQAFSRSALWAL